MSAAPFVLPDTLSTETVPAGRPLFRSHHRQHDPWHMSVGNPANRFDDPSAQYGVCYTALAPIGAFVETFLRTPRGQFIDIEELEERWLAGLVFERDLTLVQVYGGGLARNRLTAAVATGPRADTQQCAAHIQAHPDAPDGILYLVRHDDDHFGAALFDRCPTPTISRDQPWRHVSEIDAICDRYGLVL